VKRTLFVMVAALVAALLVAPTAGAVDKVNTKKLRKGVTAAGILKQMRALQRVANANDGNRAAAFRGYDASLAYVERQMKRAGYKTKRHPFDFARWEQNRPCDAPA
jgi:hypothetical protein